MDELIVSVDTAKFNQYQETKLFICTLGIGWLLKRIFPDILKPLHDMSDSYKVTLDSQTIKSFFELKIADWTIMRQSKAIPLNKITDISLQQGVISAKLGVWLICIQTAGTNLPEMIIPAVSNPHETQQKLLELIASYKSETR